MKKSLLILSVLGLAASQASAFDRLTVGTADAPAYYLIYANRGTTYLTYNPDGQDIEIKGKNEAGEEVVTQAFTTNLVRSNSITADAVWTISEGSDEGTLVIKAAGHEAYLTEFFNRSNDEVSYDIDAYANTVDEPMDVYYKEFTATGGNFAYSFSLFTANGFGSEETGETNEDGTPKTKNVFYTLDASNQGDFCTNWYPEGNGGNIWWLIKVPVEPGMSIVDGLCAMAKTTAITNLEGFRGNVPAELDAVLETGISQITNMASEADYDAFSEKVDEIYTSTIAACNAGLMTTFSGKTWALKNLRRADRGIATGPYAAASTVNSLFIPSETVADPYTSFTATAEEDGGYIFYNEASKTYIGTVVENETEVCRPVTSQDNAQVLYACVKTDGTYYGIGFCINDDYEGKGLNMDTSLSNGMVYYNVNDAGSIWEVIEVSQDAMKADIVEMVENALSPYIPNVVCVAPILSKAIEDVKALPYSAQMLTQANAIKENAFADANEYLATQLGGQTFALKYLRGDNFVAVAPNVDEDGVEIEGTLNYQHVDNATNPDAQFTFVPIEDNDEGGYFVYNEATGTYFGPQQAEETDTNGNLLDTLTIVTEEYDAQDLYPTLYTFGGFYGIALPFIPGADASTPSINMNANPGLHAYMNGDAGSIWGLLDPAETSIEEIGASASKPAVEGIFDLSGRRLSRPVKGINIINGKKVLVK